MGQLKTGVPDADAVGVLKGVRVVIVDDEEDVRMLFTDVLELAGAEVHAATCARQAMTIIEQHAPHVVVSDVMMPDHDGYWLIDNIRSIGARRPRALAITGDAGKHSRDALLRAGYDAHLAKPIILETFTATVARLAGRLV
jgi:two-component system CheB/CheR fusion protein